jgi:hypothetical protein
MAVVVVRRTCINVKNDRERYRYMVIFHAIEGFLYIIRLIIIGTDLSAVSLQTNTTLGTFLGLIFLFDFLGGCVILFANIFYLLITYLIPILYETDGDDIPYLRRYNLLRVSALTCITCDYYDDHPRAILLTRFIILVGCYILRFVAFVLSAVCANRYSPRGIAFAVFASISLLPSAFTIFLEYNHYHRLWNYFPDGDAKAQRNTHHTQFLPYSIINDQRTSSWGASLCKNDKYCRSRDLIHVLMHHSGSKQYRRDDGTMIGFHRTSPKSAIGISKTGFVVNPTKSGMLGSGAYFATCIDHTQFKAEHFGTYICALVDPGADLYVTSNRKDAKALANHGTAVYFQHPQNKDEFCVRTGEQIREWIIVVDQDETRRGTNDEDPKEVIIDRFCSDVYVGCIF